MIRLVSLVLLSVPCLLNLTGCGEPDRSRIIPSKDEPARPASTQRLPDDLAAPTKIPMH